MLISRSGQQGFSLVEVLFALLLFSLSYTALMHYQQALGQGFQRQWLQRAAWRYTFQRLQGKETAGWQMQQQTQQGPDGCQLVTVKASGPSGQHAQLTQLRCDNPRR